MNSAEAQRLIQMLTIEYETVKFLTAFFDSIGTEMRGKKPWLTNPSPEDRF